MYVEVFRALFEAGAMPPLAVGALGLLLVRALVEGVLFPTPRALDISIALCAFVPIVLARVAPQRLRDIGFHAFSG